MTTTALRIHELGKQYQVGAAPRHTHTLREALVEVAKAPWRRFRNLSGRAEPEGRFWALRDVNLDVQEGEVIGIIGHNGAGKSTLLKILSQITEPTTGSVEIRGRVGSLLEVGTGFHPELSGRENIFLNGAILGMSRAEVKRKFDAIVDFSGVEEFLNTPVKRYSSGMHVRLAFAVAAHLEPEILIIDEVLAVGDAEFQAKCLGKIGDVASGGRTVLFVSHNMAAVESLCRRACLLERGRLVADGDVADVVRRYLDSGSELAGDIDLTSHPGRPERLRPLLRRLRLLDSEGQPRPSVRIGGDLRFEIELHSDEVVHPRNLGIRVIDARGLTVFTCSTRHSHCDRLRIHGGLTVTCTVRNIRLVPGRYHLRLYVRSGSEMLDEIRSNLEIEVLPLLNEATARVPSARSGVLIPESTWEVEPGRAVAGDPSADQTALSPEVRT
ncbi:MAG: ABC transporter ATP-binding protein [Planctomycetaceae bacterium]